MNKNKTALDLTASVRNDLFENVALALSRVEGKLSFLLSEDFDGNPRVAEGFSQQVVKDTKEIVTEANDELLKIFNQINQVRDKLLGL